METGEFAPGRKPTRCPSPDIADEMYQLAQKRSARLKEKRPPVEDNNRSVVDGPESESKDQAGVDWSQGYENLPQEIPTPQPVVGGGGRGKRGRGRGRGGRGKRGGRGRGRGKSSNQSESQVLQEDSVDQIEHTVKGLALSSSSSADNTILIKEEPYFERMDVAEQSLDHKPIQEGGLNKETEDLARIFTFKEESYQPGFIPGLDFSAEGSTSYLPAASSDIKPVSEIVSEITDDFFIPDDDSGRVRRSSRIKSLEGQKGRGRRREVVFSSASSIDSTLSKSLPNLNDEDSNSYHGVSSAFDGGVSPNDSISSGISSFGLPSTLGLPAAKLDDGQNSKPFKVKSRWRYSADAESMKSLSMESLQLNSSVTTNDADKESSGPIEDEFVPSRDLIKKQGHLTYNKYDVELVDKLKKFQGIEDSIFRKERKISKESKGMVCDCFLTTEDIERGEHGCIEDCLNRLLMVECGPRCPTGESCMNKKFQRKQYATLEVFKTEKKGHGLRTLQLIPEGGFVIEYVGEVLDPFQFESRTKEYAKGNQEHFYFMALKADSIIDATLKGNCSRFINHSCEPNCETQKWTVNGELRIGFFTLRDLKPGEEIVFDYQFQRYGKKAQRCYCGTQSCRGWIGEEDDDDAEYDDKETDVAEAEVRSPDEDTEALEIEKAEKKKRRAQLAAERKQRKDARIRILEDAALEEELSQLERSGLKNRTHTLTLSRLMVRAEKWDDRERILNILINGDPACRRLFLDYRGLKLMYNWMINLPLPVENISTQVIKSEEYHLLFLKTLASLSIPNKTMLLDSKILSLMDTWSNTPNRTLVEIAPVPPDVQNQQPTDSATDLTTTLPDTSNSSIENETILPVALKEEPDKMEVDEIYKNPAEDCGVKPMEEDAKYEEKYNIWSFQNIAQTLITSWAYLKEVFRIPKKERVEQMKEHEREADKGSSPLPTTDSISSYSYDQGRSKWGTNRNGRDRRLPTTESLYRGQPRIKDLYPHLSKEQKRKLFAQKVAQEEEDMRQRRMQDEMIIMHQHRCNALGLDPSTTPVVDISGHYYLDPSSIQWLRIIPHDPGLPPGIQQMLNAAKAKETIQVPPEPAESEYVFPPWPEGLPPPPPLPPASLPDGWKMAVDDEGRCYYYHHKVQQAQWTPPTAEDCQRIMIESSESSDSEAIEEEEEDTSDNVKHTPPPSKSVSTLRTRLHERAKRRKNAGLVQERIISPRTEDDKSTISKAVIRARKLEVLEEKRQKAVEDAQKSYQTEDDDDNNSVGLEDNAENLESSDEMIKTPSPKLTIPSNAELSLSISGDDDDDSDDIHASSSPIETELDISLASIVDDNYGSPTAPEDNMIMIPGLDPILDRVSTPSTPSSSSAPPVVGVKKERSSKHERKQKTMAYKKIASDKSKEQFRSQIANVVVTHLNPYKKPDCKTGRIVSTEDFKHLARKMTHAILLKELKHSRGNKPLEVTDGVKQKTKEYVKKFMGRFGNSNYIPSPEDSSQK